MGNEISTAGGCVATVVSGVAAGATCGQVKVLNESVKECARFTKHRAKDTIVRHTGEALACTLGTVSCGILSGICLGKVETLNKSAKSCCNGAKRSGGKLATAAAREIDVVTNGLPAIGYMKGAVYYSKGNTQKADLAMKGSSRSVGVIGGAILGGFAIGPVGVVIGSVAGGLTMDVVITAAETRIKGRFCPTGHIEAIHILLSNQYQGQHKVASIVEICATMWLDGFTPIVYGGRVVNSHGSAELCAEGDVMKQRLLDNDSEDHDGEDGDSDAAQSHAIIEENTVTLKEGSEKREDVLFRRSAYSRFQDVCESCRDSSGSDVHESCRIDAVVDS